MASSVLSTMVIKLVTDISEFMGGMDEAGRKVTTTGQAMQTAGANLTAGVTLPLVGAGGAAFNFANEFNEGMANVASLGTEAAEALEGWTPMVQDIALETGKSTDDMTGGLYNVVSAFGVADDTMQVLEINAKAAAAGLADTTDAINLTSAVTKGYGDTSAEAVQKVSDLSLKTVQLGQTTFPELASSIGRVVPLANQLNVSQEELFATMATLTGVTGNAGEVSTQLRGVLQSLMAPTGDMAGLMGELGYESGEAMLESLGLQGTIDAITQAAEETGTPLQKYIGSIEGQTLALALSGSQSEVYTDKLAAMGEAAGATEQAFLAQTQGVNAAGFAVSQAQVQMSIMAQTLGQSLATAFLTMQPLLTGVLNRLTAMIDRFANLDPKIQGAILAVLGVVAALGPLLLIIGTVVSGIGGLITTWGALSAAVAASGPVLAAIAAFLTGPVALAIGAVIATVGLLVLAWNTNFLGIRDTTLATWNDYIKPAWEELTDWVVGTLIPTIEDLWNRWVNVIFPQIEQATQNAVTIVTSLFDEVGRWINENLVPWLEYFGETWATQFQAIQAVLSIAWNFIQPIFSNLKGWMEAQIPNAISFLASKFASDFGMIQGSIDLVRAYLQELENRVVGFWNWITSHTFSFNIQIPDLPDWATPSSPLPIHTAWQNFDRDLRGMSFQPALSAQPLSGASGVLEPAGLGTGGPIITININGDVYGIDDLNTRINDAINETVAEAFLLKGSL